MNHTATAPDPPAAVTTWYHHLLADLALLHKAAHHLRTLGWLGLVVWSFLLFVLVIQFMVLGPGPMIRKVVVVGAIAAVGFTCWIAPYFYLARQVARGRRWGIVTALVLIACCAAWTVVLLGLFIAKSPNNLVGITLETVYLLGHLTLLKLLWQSLGAAARIERQSLPPLDALPADHPA